MSPAAPWTRASALPRSRSLAQIRYCIERLPAGRDKNLLATVADELFSEFQDQVLPFDVATANRCAAVVARRDQVGRPIEGFDAQIAAICHTRDATPATRNIKDFEDAGIDVVNPWQAA